MQRERWTIVRWCARTCEYVRQRLNEPLPPLFVRNTRIPHIDKIARKAPDTRVREFASAMRGLAETGSSRLTEWMPSLDHNTLEEFALVLALNKGLDAIPPEVRHRLERLGTYEYLAREVEGFGKPDVVPEASAKEWPLDVLQLTSPEGGAYSKQKLIDSVAGVGPQLAALQQSWKTSLGQFQGRGPQDPVLLAHLPFEEQCTIVASELAALSAQIASTPFPRSLSRVCRKVGDALEHGMLLNVARKEGLPAVHRRSHYLWGLTGLPRWTSKQRIVVGSWWVELALKQCRFDMLHQGRSVSRPAFWRTWHMSGPTKRGIFVLNQSLLKLLRATPAANESIVSKTQIPLLIPPRPWTGLRATAGPLASREIPLVAQQGHSTEGQFAIKEAIRSGAMQPHLDGINRLSQQAWQINTRVLNTVLQLGPHVCGAAASEESSFPNQWQQALRIAQALGEQKFYLPAYIDFRGRSYPFSGSMLNYMGKDPIRALFQFGGRAPLGPHGLHWLEVHLANMYGQCKGQSEKAKRDWVSANRKHIIQSTEEPIQSSWWRAGAKPFQVLAACFEVSSAWDSPDPAQYETKLPVQLDGTCNGLQHLVSVARDERNAEHVNVVKRSDGECGDVYSAVARVASDDDKPIGRCMVKDAVMTFFYGASLHRMLETLREHGVEDALPVAQRIQACLDDMFSRERAVQHWLMECARRITSSCRADQPVGTTTVAWTSLLGMPVVQPYVDPKLIAVRTPLQTFYLPSEYHQAPIDRKRQLAAVVANFVHSLDAAHMLATARALPPNVSFVAVHDSFWVRAGDVPVLSRVLREQFAWLHGPDLLAGLVDEWRARYRGYMVLGRAYRDSPLYEKALWRRGGVTAGRKLQEHLNTELRLWYEGKPQLPCSGVVWDAGAPFVGTPGQASTKVWFPLEFPPLPARGQLDVAAVLDSPYFFS